MKSIKLFLEDKTVWLYLGGHVIVSILLAIGAILIDTRMIETEAVFPEILMTRWSSRRKF